MVITTIVLASVSVVGAKAESPKIVERVVPGGYEITILNFVGGDQNEAQALIGPNVQRLCGQLSPQWGRFMLDAMIVPPKGKALKPGRFRQMIKCVPAQPVEVAEPTPPFTATPDDDTKVRVTTLKFLDLRDRGESEGSFKMLSPSMQDTTNRSEWQRDISAKPAKTGGGVERAISKVSWYVDPPGVAAGVYAAADFEGASQKLAIHCGFVALKLQPSGSFLVVRIEEGYLAKEQARTLSALRLTEMRTALQCRN